jgi:hypothetical protein
MIDETNPNNNNISCNNQPTDDHENEQVPPHMRVQEEGTRTKRKYPFHGMIVAFLASKVFGEVEWWRLNGSMVFHHHFMK